MQHTPTNTRQLSTAQPQSTHTPNQRTPTHTHTHTANQHTHNTSCQAKSGPEIIIQLGTSKQGAESASGTGVRGGQVL